MLQVLHPLDDFSLYPFAAIIHNHKHNSSVNSANPYSALASMKMVLGTPKLADGIRSEGGCYEHHVPDTMDIKINENILPWPAWLSWLECYPITKRLWV